MQSPSADEAAITLSGVRQQLGDFSLAVDCFSLNKGERTLVLGPSGSGKSTLLNLIAGVTVAENGAVTVLGQDLNRLSATHRDRLRGETFGLIFQTLNLLPYATAIDNVQVALLFAPKRRARATSRSSATAADLLTGLGLPNSALRRPVSTLSVGQQQRVAIARALIGRPAIVIADEPTSALDSASRDRFLDLLFASFDADQQSLLVVSHDEAIAARFDRVVTMEELSQQPDGGAA